MESDVCDFCQNSIESKELLEKQKMREQFGILKKKLVLSAGIIGGIAVVFAVLLIIMNISSSNNSSSNNYHKNESYNSYETYENDDVPNGNENTAIYVDSIIENNGVAYFNIGLDEYISSYNDTLKGTAEEALGVLNTQPNYVGSLDYLGNGQTSKMYDVSSYAQQLGKTYGTYISVDENNKITQLCLGIRQGLGKINLGEVIEKNLEVPGRLLTGFSESEWDMLMSQFVNNFNNKQYPFAYQNGVCFMIDYNESVSCYYVRIQSMTEEYWNNSAQKNFGESIN